MVTLMNYRMFPEFTMASVTALRFQGVLRSSTLEIVRTFIFQWFAPVAVDESPRRPADPHARLKPSPLGSGYSS
jgi:hypothetical protein